LVFVETENKPTNKQVLPVTLFASRILIELKVHPQRQKVPFYVQA
jgi:hypothetical protein